MLNEEHKFWKFGNPGMQSAIIIRRILERAESKTTNGDKKRGHRVWYSNRFGVAPSLWRFLLLIIGCKNTVLSSTIIAAYTVFFCY